MSSPHSSAVSGAERHGRFALHPFRATRPTAHGARLAAQLCPPYDVVDAATRSALLTADQDNFVSVTLPRATPDGYAAAVRTLSARLDRGVLAVDQTPALYVYEMVLPGGHVTRGLVGAVDLHDPADGVILPHENTMAGPVADRLALMTATGADLEPIYLLYEGGGSATAAVAGVDGRAPLAETVTPDGVHHRLWSIRDPQVLASAAADLAGRRAVIADGHHRYATYRERQRAARSTTGRGPWDRGLTYLVDSTAYGPQVQPIHRVVAELSLPQAVERAQPYCDVRHLGTVSGSRALDAATQRALADSDCFAVVLSDGHLAAELRDTRGELRRAAADPDQLSALSELDVSVLHRGLLEEVWGVRDDVDHVGYAHSVTEALDAARSACGVAVLVRATPAETVTKVAIAGARMPRKSTLFTPKPASGLFLRRLADDPDMLTS